MEGGRGEAGPKQEVGRVGGIPAVPQAGCGEASRLSGEEVLMASNLSLFFLF